MIDFTNCPVNRFRAYGGANGNKINITYQGHSYMLKFPPKPSRNRDMSYSNGCISEYIACHIFEMLGFRTQETLLGNYTDSRSKTKLVPSRATAATSNTTSSRSWATSRSPSSLSRTSSGCTAV